MTEVLHANIFFIIASVATVVFCLLVCLILYQFYRIAKSVRAIIERIESASDLVADDVAHARKLIATQGLFASLLSFAFGNAKARKKRAKDDTED